jgi:DNA/RNA endonuclease G (NUC1)
MPNNNDVDSKWRTYRTSVRDIETLSTYNLLSKTPRNIINTFYKNWKILEDKHNEDHEQYF